MMNKNVAAIGVFDSGIGGLTGARALRQLLPGEDIIYFGDTARVPYGSRNVDTIIGYAKQDIAFLLSKNVKAIMAACGTVSSTLPLSGSYLESLPVPYIGVVEAAAQTAAYATKNMRVGVIGTEATIATASYEKAIKSFNPEIQTFAVSCPLFVPLVENAHFAKGDALAMLAAKEYLLPLKEKGIDTLVLGCTHYPLLADVIADVVGKNVVLIDPGKMAALKLKDLLEKNNLLSMTRNLGVTSYYVSDSPEKFAKTGSLFLGEQLVGGFVEKIDINKF